MLVAAVNMLQKYPCMRPTSKESPPSAHSTFGIRESGFFYGRRGAYAVPTLTLGEMLQEAGSSRGVARALPPQGEAEAGRAYTPSGNGRPTNTPSKTTNTHSRIVLKDGEPIPEGYKYVVEGQVDAGANARTALRSAPKTVDLRTPPKLKEPDAGEAAEAAKNLAKDKRNMTRNTNRKANTSFARELKDSLASGRKPNVKVPAEQSDLKSAWHAAAKEVAYKFLDLRKESWKDYSFFEKSVVHNQLNEAYKFDPPLDPKRVDKFLSGHLRTSRAVWKAHWKKEGPENRHHNCPEEAWAKLITVWPTAACQEEAADMASRRARVEKTSIVGRSSLMDRMEAEVSRHSFLYAITFYCN
jgi:hypothetical protein